MMTTATAMTTTGGVNDHHCLYLSHPSREAAKASNEEEGG